MGGKDEWGKKKRSELRHDRYDRLSESDKEAGFLSAPWKFFKLGASTKGDTDGADASGARLLPVKKMLPMRLLPCVQTNQEMANQQMALRLMHTHTHSHVYIHMHNASAHAYYIHAHRHMHTRTQTHMLTPN